MFDRSKVIISYENYKGGINNLIVAQYGFNGVVSTSLINEDMAIEHLKRKINKQNRSDI